MRIRPPELRVSMYTLRCAYIIILQLLTPSYGAPIIIRCILRVIHR
jgi:hypothetical protein